MLLAHGLTCCVQSVWFRGSRNVLSVARNSQSILRVQGRTHSSYFINVLILLFFHIQFSSVLIPLMWSYDLPFLSILYNGLIWCLLHLVVHHLISMLFPIGDFLHTFTNIPVCSFVYSLLEEPSGPSVAHCQSQANKPQLEHQLEDLKHSWRRELTGWALVLFQATAMRFELTTISTQGNVKVKLRCWLPSNWIVEVKTRWSISCRERNPVFITLMWCGFEGLEPHHPPDNFDCRI